MTLSPNFNPTSASTSRYLNRASDQLGAAQQRLSSGLRTADPSYDPGSSAIGSVLTSDINVLKQATRNTATGSAMLDFIMSSLGNYSDILNRMRTLATEANSSGMGATQLAALDQEYQSLTGQLTAIAQNTKWLGTQLLNNAGNMVFQVGVSSTSTVTINTIDLTPGTANFAPSTTNTNVSLGSLSINSANNAANALNNTTLAIQHISEEITKYGAAKSYLRYVADNLSSEIASKSETKSILLDADVTEELMNIQSQKAMFDTASVMFQQSLAKQEQIAQIVKQAST